MTRALVALDRDSAEPLYRQLREALAHGIACGTLDATAPLPPTRQLAAELGLSRNTINAAYQELIAEGFINARPRRGLFVNPQMRPHVAPVADSGTAAPARPPTFDWAARLAPPTAEDLPQVCKPADWHRKPYPFAVGQPDVSHFPARAWSRALRDALLPEHLHASLDDHVAADDPLLIATLRRQVLSARGVEADPDQILITMGSQHALSLLAGLLLGPGATVGVEDPGYLDARHIFTRAGATLRPIPVDADGLVPPPQDRLGDLDLLYLTPSHHHPTNATLSMGRRREVLAGLTGRDTVVIEDDYDSELRYAGSPSPALKSLDQAGRVVYLGTFSKFLAPGLRLGYLVGSRELVAELRARRRYELRHPPGHQQRALALLIADGDYQRIVRQHRQRMRGRWEESVVAVRTHLPWQTDFPAGGGSLWMTGPPVLDCRRLQSAALEHGIVIERGDIFFSAQDPPRNHFRLGFSAIPRHRIEPGLRLLAQIADTIT